MKLTGVDPLDAFYLNPKVDFSNTGGGLKLHHIVDILNPPPPPAQQPKQSDHKDDIDDCDGSKTLTDKGATLTAVSSRNDDYGAVCGAAATPAVLVPSIVIQTEDEDGGATNDTSTTLSQSLSSDHHQPSQPSVITESQRLFVIKSDAGAASDSSSASSTPSGSPTSSPLSRRSAKAIKNAAKIEKREKMPTKTRNRSSASTALAKNAAAAAAAAVEERLAKLELKEEEEEEEGDGSKREMKETDTSKRASDGAREETVLDTKPISGQVIDSNSKDDVAARAPGSIVIDEGSSSPRAPPRLRTRSRKGHSMRKQLSLIEEEEKARR